MRFSKMLLAVSLFTGLVFAGATTTTTTTTTTEKATPKVVMFKIAGKVEAVDAIGNTLVIKTAKKSDTISITTSTKITNIGKPVTLSDIKTGESVRALCLKEEGKLVASSVKLGVAPAKKPAENATPATPAQTK